MAKSHEKPRTPDKAIRRAIRKSDPTHESPTVGKPVIIDSDEDKTKGQTDKKKSSP